MGKHLVNLCRVDRCVSAIFFSVYHYEAADGMLTHLKSTIPNSNQITKPILTLGIVPSDQLASHTATKEASTATSSSRQKNKQNR